MKNKRNILMGVCALAVLAVGGPLVHKLLNYGAFSGNLADQALLALIKNDQKAFESFVEAGGDLHSSLPVIDGKVYTVSQGLSYFERPNFVKYLQSKKMKFIQQDKSAPYDILTLSVPKNNPELLGLYMMENPDILAGYGDKQWTLLHMASAVCSHKLTSLLHEKGGLTWNLKARDGSTPLTLAAEHECLPMLGYWKDRGADFYQKDGRGVSALSILKKKKDAALLAFAQSFESRLPAAMANAAQKPEINFYKKRKIPKDQIVDPSTLIEPEDRPIEPVETAEFSEFAD